MADKDNSVNIGSAIPAERGAYHHGDLRAAAVEAGLARLAVQTDPDLGLRAIARDIGVSPTALYRHFPNKDALLDALAGEGLGRLGHQQAAAVAAAGGGRDGFLASGTAYVAFARENPALFRLTFSRIGKVELDSPEPAAMGDAYRLLREGVAAAVPGAVSSAQSGAMALHAWSLVHGLAMLILDGRVAYDAAQVREVLAMTFGGTKRTS